MRKSKMRLGELLKAEGLISDAQLEKALQTQKKEGGQIGELFVKLGFVTEQAMVAALGKQLDIPFVSRAKGLLKPDPNNEELRSIIPEHFAKEHLLIPISKSLKSLTVAFSDPLNLMAMDDLKRMTGCEINPVVGTKTDIKSAIDEFYGGVAAAPQAQAAAGAATDESAPKQAASAAVNLDDVFEASEDTNIIQLVDSMILKGVKDRASDIHIEPFDDKIRLRYRIDGVLHDVTAPSKDKLSAIVSRIKIMAKLDIAEKRLPQDGAVDTTVDKRPIEMRISVMPTVYGEKVVMRIMDAARMALNLDKLGFEPSQVEAFKRAVFRPYGLIFLTGPTGSGKSTTLYSALNFVKSPRKNVLTIEDPVEFRVDGVNQVQARPTIGLTFAAGLRAFLRQDPDIIMVGEVRDLETSQICVRAALTGHLVLSTLHTNTASGAINRLINLGVEPYLLTSSLLMLVAQRLVRKLCDKCKVTYKPSSEELIGAEGLKGKTIYKPKGCVECGNTGYRGRIAIHETLSVTEKIKEMVMKGATPNTITQVAREGGMLTLRESGIEKIKAGLTSLEEIFSITYEEEGA